MGKKGLNYLQLGVLLQQYSLVSHKLLDWMSFFKPEMHFCKVLHWLSQVYCAHPSALAPTKRNNVTNRRQMGPTMQSVNKKKTRLLQKSLKNKGKNTHTQLKIRKQVAIIHTENLAQLVKTGTTGRGLYSQTIRGITAGCGEGQPRQQGRTTPADEDCAN